MGGGGGRRAAQVVRVWGEGWWGKPHGRDELRSQIRSVPRPPPALLSFR
jgi:hypothetical protein